MRRLSLVGLIVFATSAGGCWRGPERPLHVVIVSIDTLRADRLGVYGDTLAHTPELDALAAESVLFEQAIAVAPSTLASHTAMFTGNHPHRHGVPRNDHEVGEPNVLLQEILAEAGFHTAAFLGAIPLGSHSHFPQGFHHLDEDFTLHRMEDRVAQTMRPAEDVNTALTAWLDARNDDRPLFLFAHYFDAHQPYKPPPRWRKVHGITQAGPNAGSMRHIARTRMMVRKALPEAERNVELLHAMYRASISHVDEQLGALLDELRARNLLDDTLLIVTSDHGESFADHEERFDHGASVYDDTIHVPLLVRFPQAWGGGRRVPVQVSGVDLLPSVLDALGLPIPDVEGRTWLPEARGAWFTSDRGPAVSEATKPHVATSDPWLNAPMQKSVRHEGWKLIADPRRQTARLFDLTADPGELADVAHDEPDRRAALNTLLSTWRLQADPIPSARISSARVKAELAALGYTEALDEEGAHEAAPTDTDDPP